MEMVSGWQVFSKEEMDNDNAIKVFSDMIQILTMIFQNGKKIVV